MEKLIKLLNVYGTDYCGHNYERYLEYNRIVWEGCDNSDCSELLIISEKFGFIKWLVENDKIEFREDFYLEDQHGGGFGEDENIIMLLSIQDNPIEFLISILKVDKKSEFEELVDRNIDVAKRLASK